MRYLRQLSSHPASVGAGRAVAGAILIAWAGGGCGSASPTKAELIGVQGGTFIMGSTTGCSDSGGASCAGDRVPHKVRVSPFKVDNVEVTRRLYAECVKKGMCLAPGATFAEDSDQPALVDDPALARAYCATRSMRLPTEAEFEFLSRTSLTGDAQNFAWGNQPPTCSRLPMKGCTERRPRPVGTSPGDVNLFGIFDLAGSVPEWVDDDYTPYIGCADRMSYGELCWGRSAGCADTRCSNDGAFCASGCLPGQASATSAGGSDGPLCPVAPDAALLIDPIIRGDYPFHVVRGGGPDDTACAFAGFTRRYAAVKSFAAGFRCAVSLDARPRAGTSTYRFVLTGCPPAGRVRVSLKSGGAAAGYTLDWFPNGATGIKSATADKGIVDDVPCDAVMVIYPSTTENVSVSVSTVGSPACYSVTTAPTLSATTDTPIKGVDTLKLMPAMGCP